MRNIWIDDKSRISDINKTQNQLKEYNRNFVLSLTKAKVTKYIAIEQN
jgi:hypothetical protein